MSHADTMRQFFKDLERIDFEAVAAHCSDDCRYEDVPVGDDATAVGPEAIVAKLSGGLGDLEALVTTIHEIAEDGDTVLVERTEVWHHPTGERAPSWPSSNFGMGRSSSGVTIGTCRL